MYFSLLFKLRTCSNKFTNKKIKYIFNFKTLRLVKKFHNLFKNLNYYIPSSI